MKDLNYDLRQLCERNRDGSYATQGNRQRILSHCADLLHEMGFRKMHAASLKPKHVESLVERWKSDNLSPGSIKNKMTALRWWAEKIGKRSIIARDNDHYGIERRQFVTGKDKSQSIEKDNLEKIGDVYTRMSVELQQAFGLRREEAIKFQPHYAMATLDQGYIQLKDTWTKGGKARNVTLSPALKETQLDVLQRAAKLAGKGSLIPPDKRYVDQLRVYERHTSRAGLSKLHGLRHRYAQDRYQEITGWSCPARGGIPPIAMEPGTRAQDREARQLISRELGHERIQIVAIYLGG